MAMDRANLKTRLKAEARRLGFDECKVAPVGEAPHAPAFKRWLDQGRAGEMEWLKRDPERRTHPAQVLPGCRSLILLAMNYWQGHDAPAPSPAPRGRFARYARGDDYHDLIIKRLRELEGVLTKEGGTQRSYVDTGPVLERDWAAKAGLGWHGKSTMLIHTSLGTWFFIGTILTTLDLPVDEPARDHCGRCTRCIDACPTGAITAPHQLDARLCVSYLTIELRGSIPEHLRHLIGDRVFGCDDCLDACPWNRFARQSRESTFMAREAVDLPLRELLEMDEETFRASFRKSPVKRVKHRGLRRNVCVALGNTGGPDDLPALEKAAREDDPLITEHAEWAIAQIHKRHALTPSK